MGTRMATAALKYGLAGASEVKCALPSTWGTAGLVSFKMGEAWGARAVANNAKDGQLNAPFGTARGNGRAVLGGQHLSGD
jgi:hypothetical protein